MTSPLLTPTTVGPLDLRNRIMSSAHQTTLVHDHLPTEDFFAYHRARADGGVGLIVLEAHGTHPSGLLTGHTLDASSDELVEAYRPFAADLQDAGARVVAQLLHGGRERYDGEYAPPPPAPSAVPSDRLHSVPRPLPTDEVYEIIDSFATAAAGLERAGLDGVEFAGSHAYLPAQFWNPALNHRGDEFGGSLENRCRFTVEALRRIRGRTSSDFAVGFRFSAEERSKRGMSLEATLEVVDHVGETAPPDYWSVVVGSSSTQRGCTYIVPPATESSAVVRGPAERVDELVDEPVIVTSRLDTPGKAEVALEGAAEVVGMTRALIADPDLPAKLAADEAVDVTPCVACNQGCIGRYQQGLPIRCTVNPATGRERDYRELGSASTPRRILVVGGGPAGMTAATAAAQRGHDVTLLEATAALGGQVRAYADLDHRGAFEKWLGVLERRLRETDVRVELEKRFAADALDPDAVDAIVLATGATGGVPDDVDVATGAPVTTARAVLDDDSGPTTAGVDRVVIADWDGNHAALDVAMEYTAASAAVELVTAADAPGEAVQQYVRNQLLGRLDERDVTYTPHHRVTAVDRSTVTVTNQFTEATSTRDGVDRVVFAYPGEADHDLAAAVEATGVETHRVGDGWAPRSLDEATWEAYRVAAEL